MTRLVTATLMVLAFCLASSRADALNITQTFCAAGSDAGEDDSCPAGLTATLQLQDLNEAERQYLVTLTVDTSAANFNVVDYTSIQQVQFDISGVKGDKAPPWGDYEAPPTLDSSGVDGDLAWTVYFDQVNNGSGCSANGNNSQHVCAGVGALAGTDTGDIDIWKFTVDLDNTFPILTAALDLNLRVAFMGPLDENGRPTNGTILSPDFRNIPDTGPGPNPDVPVPEPTSLILLGSGLALATGKLRRKRPH